MGGLVKLTVSNIWLDLISLKVSSETQISQQGQVLGVRDLKLGQEIAMASYNPVTLEASTLLLDPPIETGRASR